MTWAGMAHHFNYSLNVCDEDHSCRYAGPEQFVNFSFRSVYFVRMKLQLSSISYYPTIGHGDRSVRLVEFD